MQIGIGEDFQIPCRLFSNGKHAATTGGQGKPLLLDAFAIRWLQRLGIAIAPLLRQQGQQFFRRAFHQNPTLTVLILSQHSVIATLGLEWQFLQPLPLFAIRMRVQLLVACCLEQGCVGHMGQGLGTQTIRAGVAGRNQNALHIGMPGIDSDDVVPIGQLLQAELAFGQGARFVRTQQVGTTEGFHRTGIAHQGTAAGKPVRRRQLRHGGQQRQTFWHCRNRQTDAGTDQFVGRAMLHQARRHDRNAADGRHRCRHGGNRVQTGFDTGCLATVQLLLPAGPLGFAQRPHCDDHRFSPPGDNRGAFVQHAGTVTQCRGKGWRGIFRDWQGFTGQTGFVGFDTVGQEQSTISRDGFAGFQHQDIAGYQRVSINPGPFTIPQDAHLLLFPLIECRHRPFGTLALYRTQHCIQADHRDDDAGVPRRTCQCRQGCSREQDRGQRIRHFLYPGREKLAQQRRRWRLDQQAADDLIRGQSEGRGAKLLQTVFCGQHVPGRQIAGPWRRMQIQPTYQPHAIAHGQQCGGIGGRSNPCNGTFIKAAQRHDQATEGFDSGQLDTLLRRLARLRHGVDAQQYILHALTGDDIGTPRWHGTARIQDTQPQIAGVEGRRRLGTDVEHAATTLLQIMDFCHQMILIDHHVR